MLVLGISVLTVLFIGGNAFLDNQAKNEYKQAVESENYKLVRCLDTAFSGSEKMMCNKYK